MVAFSKLGKDNDFSGHHFIFEKYEDYLKYVDHFKYPRIDGDWKIAIIDIPIKNIREILDNVPARHVNITFYLKTDVLQRLQIEYPKFFTELQSKWQQYLEVIATLDKPIEKKASSELYKRTQGDMVEAKKVLDFMIKEYEDTPTITYQQVVSSIHYVEKVYARDVVLHLLLKSNKQVPPKGSILSKYKYHTWQSKLNDLIEEIGHDVAFYSIRKYINRLYENKMAYLFDGDSEVKDKDVIKILDVYEILHAQIAFLDKRPLQLYSILKVIEGRTTNVSIIDRTFNTSRK